jgi:hypothetical protein
MNRSMEIKLEDYIKLCEADVAERNEIEDELVYGDIDVAELNETNDAERNEIDDEMLLKMLLNDNEYLEQVEKWYDAEIKEINDAVVHSSVCQLEYCEIKLCSLFKSYFTEMRNRLAGTLLTCSLPTSFKYCVRFHQHFMCTDENCPVPECWNYKETDKLLFEIFIYYNDNENRDVSKDYNNNDE